MIPPPLLAILLLTVVLPVVVWASLEVYKRRMAFKERELELTADRTAEKAAQYAAHVEQLEARVRVLERIATDKGADLAQRIEDLRDAEHPVPQAQQREKV